MSVFRIAGGITFTMMGLALVGVVFPSQIINLGLLITGIALLVNK